jgi:EAL domain-containing protein (putative c-di-GMP-specific phosphodiesterase class I)
VAEQTGIILALGQWVLETACWQLQAWSLQSETAHLSLAVNVSARQFRQSGFVEQVLAALEATGADPKRLKLELTESLLLDDVEDVIDKMAALKAHGVGFSLDDFGTGYSSLSYLKRLPLDQLKIDRAFVRDVLSSTSDAAIARTIVTLGQHLDLKVVAEGIETGEQWEFLKLLNCQTYQGYLFGKPVPAAQFEADLTRETA